jgi:hypothetical protein
MLGTCRPAAGEFAPFYAGYVARIGDDEDILAVLGEQLHQFPARMEQVPESRGEHRYAPGKWSVKEVVGHLSDSERIFAYRALRFGRGDPTALPGFEEDEYVPPMVAGARTLADLVAEWSDVRRATIALFRHLPAEAWQRRGTASGKPVSVRALAYIIAGHLRHHVEVLEARYLREGGTAERR